MRCTSELYVRWRVNATACVFGSDWKHSLEIVLSRARRDGGTAVYWAAVLDYGTTFGRLVKARSQMAVLHGR